VVSDETLESAAQADWAATMRAGMPSATRWAYLDHAAVAPLPDLAAAAINDWVADSLANGATDWNRWRQRVEQLRTAAARLLRAATDDVAVIHNTTEGVGLVAEGLDWKPGDNMVVPACEFPSNLYAWLQLEQRGVEVRVVPVECDHIDYADIEAAVDNRTRLVAISWIGFRSGFRIDPARVARIAHRYDAWLFLDAIQGLGAFPIDVEAMEIDALAADGHKWLLGPEGAGVFFVRPELLDQLRPLGVGWNSVRHAGDFTNTALDLKPHAGRYEGGTYNMPGIVGLAASIDWINGFGIETISRQILDLTAELCDRLKSIGATLASDRSIEHASGIVSFSLPGQSPTEVQRACRDQDIVINSRDGRLRASPHAYSTPHDIDRLISLIEPLIGSTLDT
jgi:cysteine desulfurase/selenocysteine lyase